MFKVREKSGLLYFIFASYSHPSNHRLQSIATQLWPKLKDRLAEGKKSDCKFIPRPNCNWATLNHKQETLEKVQEAGWLQTKVQLGNDAQKVTRISNSNGKMLISKVKVTTLICPAKGFFFPTVELPMERIPWDISKGCGYFQELPLSWPNTYLHNWFMWLTA